MTDRNSIFFERDRELHALCMNCFGTYRQQYEAATAGKRPLTEDDKRWFRQLKNEPEPFDDEWQERFLSTLLNDDQFRRAFLVALRGPQ